MSEHQLNSSRVREVASKMLAAIFRQQDALGLTNTELAKRVGVSRMTVQRARAEEADPQFQTVVAMAAVVGLTPIIQGANEETAMSIREAECVHRGLAYNRLRRDKGWRDTQRETALAKRWEAANKYPSHGLGPVMRDLVPGYTQEQASAVATAIQWLGSDVGFAFFRDVMKAAGYTIVDDRERARS